MCEPWFRIAHRPSSAARNWPRTIREGRSFKRGIRPDSRLPARRFCSDRSKSATVRSPLVGSRASAPSAIRGTRPSTRCASTMPRPRCNRSWRRTSPNTFSPDGASLYVATSDARLRVFSRDGGTGTITLVQTLMDGHGGVAGIGNVPAVVVSPDGEHVSASGGGSRSREPRGRRPSASTAGDRVRSCSSWRASRRRPTAATSTPRTAPTAAGPDCSGSLRSRGYNLLGGPGVTPFMVENRRTGSNTKEPSHGTSPREDAAARIIPRL
jgi:hypothetical protein